jgi:flagellar hook-associated protein 1 FlgK
MSLFGTIQMGASSLKAASLGLQVTGNNIANANTPDYIRERLIQSPQLPQHLGTLLLGLGVKVEGVVEVIDKFLDERLRNATSDLAGTEAQDNAYTYLESAINELGGNDVSTSLTTFFNSIHDALNQPESASVRNLVVQKGQSLAESIRRLDSQVRTQHQDVNNQIVATANDINRLLADVAKLNEQIIAAEGGDTSPSDAVGLRDRRAADLAQLAEITDIRTIEQPTGDVTVYSGGDYLVNRATYRTVKVVTEVDDGLTVSEVRIAELDAPITSGGGRLGGLIAARDTVLHGFLTEFNQLAGTLINEFNKIYSGGQGLVGYNQLTSTSAVTSTSAALDEAGLPFTPTNGIFQLHVYNSQTNQRQTVDIRVDLNGLDTDTNLTTLTAQLDAVDGIAASVTADGKLQITADSPQVTFAFADDTSGVLAALGLNTFFSGTDATDIGIDQLLRSDPKKLALASGGVGQDTQNGELLANFLTQPLASQDNLSLATMYDRMTTNVAETSQTTHGIADGLRSFQQTLQSQHLAVSGVNIDEEAVRMIEYQRTFQASARLIATVNEMLQTLLDL